MCDLDCKQKEYNLGMILNVMIKGLTALYVKINHCYILILTAQIQSNFFHVTPTNYSHVICTYIKYCSICFSFKVNIQVRYNHMYFLQRTYTRGMSDPQLLCNWVLIVTSLRVKAAFSVKMRNYVANDAYFARING